MNSKAHKLIIGHKAVAVAIFGAIVVVFIYGLVHLLIWNELSSRDLRYVPITMSANEDEAQIYAPRIAEVAEGKLFFGDTALKEHENEPMFLPVSGSIVFGMIARLTGIEWLWILTTILIPAILFLFFFVIARLLTGSIPIAFASSFLLIFFREIASRFPFYDFHQFKVFITHFLPYVVSGIYNTRLEFHRIESPLWTWLVLALFYFFFVLVIRSEKKWPIVPAALLYGLEFYTYLYDWIAVSLVLGIFFVASLAVGERKLAGKTAIIMFGGLIFSSYYWISQWKVMHLPQFQEFINRAGLEVGRVFRWSLWPNYLAWIGAGAFSLLYAKRNTGNPYGNNISGSALLAGSTFLAVVLALNIQIFTGYVPQPDHFLRHSFAFLLWGAYLIFGKILWDRFRPVELKSYFYALIFIAVILVFARSVQIQIGYASHNFTQYTIPSAVEESFSWMRKELPPDSIVLTPSLVNTAHLLIFTPAKTFLPSTGVITLASDKELVERYIIAAKLFGIDDELITAIFDVSYLTNPRVIKNLEGGGGLALFHHGFGRQDPNAYFTPGNEFREIPHIAEAAAAALVQWSNDRTVSLNQYSFDYVYVGPDEKKSFSFNKGAFPLCLEDFYHNEEVDIYRLCRVE